MMLKLLAAGLVFTSSVNAATNAYEGRRGTQTVTRPYTDAEWVERKLAKIERGEKRAANADWRKDERKAFRAHLEANGEWAGKTSTARAEEKADREAGRDTKTENKRAAKFFGTGWGGNKEDSMEFTEAEARMSRSDRNEAYRTRKKGEDGAAEAALAAASTFCKTKLRNKLRKCLILEGYANADTCNLADSKKAQLQCTLWRQTL